MFILGVTIAVLRYEIQIDVKHVLALMATQTAALMHFILPELLLVSK